MRVRVSTQVGKRICVLQLLFEACFCTTVGAIIPNTAGDSSTTFRPGFNVYGLQYVSGGN